MFIGPMTGPDRKEGEKPSEVNKQTQSEEEAGELRENGKEEGVC